MSNILEKEDIKNKCQKFTPSFLVDEMLDLAEYNKNLYGKKILENSFGSGNILIRIVKRYIEDCLDLKFANEKISSGLSQDIYGIEFDMDLFHETLNKLNDVVACYNLPRVEWKLFNQDALRWESKIKFDYIIGNPPYLTYRKLDKQTREYLRDKFEVCKEGKFDYCYAFIENGLNFLNDTGKLVQLIPCNIFKNVFAKKVRDILKNNISVVYEYPAQKLFENALTSTSIFLLDKSKDSSHIIYEDKTKEIKRLVNKNDLCDKWFFSDIEKNEVKLTRFGDMFHASMVVATLYNKAYLVSEQDIEQYQLEHEVIKKSASPRGLRFDKKEYIIFPYKYEDHHLLRFEKEIFEKKFPNVTSYLKRYEKKLSNRKSDRNVEWFEYGRSQALKHLNIEKLLLSTVITDQPEVFLLDIDTIPYSGIYITVKDSNHSLQDAINILNSLDFKKYVKKVGISMSGESVRITSKDINDFMFEGD